MKLTDLAQQVGILAADAYWFSAGFPAGKPAQIGSLNIAIIASDFQGPSHIRLARPNNTAEYFDLTGDVARVFTWSLQALRRDGVDANGVLVPGAVPVYFVSYASFHEFDKPGQDYLTKAEVERVWARRLAVAVFVDAVLPWKLADLSLEDFFLLFVPWTVRPEDVRDIAIGSAGGGPFGSLYPDTFSFFGQALSAQMPMSVAFKVVKAPMDGLEPCQGFYVQESPRQRIEWKHGSSAGPHLPGIGGITFSKVGHDSTRIHHFGPLWDPNPAKALSVALTAFPDALPPGTEAAVLATTKRIQALGLRRPSYIDDTAFIERFSSYPGWQDPTEPLFIQPNGPPGADVKFVPLASPGPALDLVAKLKPKKAEFLELQKTLSVEYRKFRQTFWELEFKWGKSSKSLQNLPPHQLLAALEPKFQDYEKLKETLKTYVDERKKALGLYHEMKALIQAATSLTTAEGPASQWLYVLQRAFRPDGHWPYVAVGLDGLVKGQALASTAHSDVGLLKALLRVLNIPYVSLAHRDVVGLAPAEVPLPSAAAGNDDGDPFPGVPFGVKPMKFIELAPPKISLSSTAYRTYEDEVVGYWQARADYFATLQKIHPVYEKIWSKYAEPDCFHFMAEDKSLDFTPFFELSTTQVPGQPVVAAPSSQIFGLTAFLLEPHPEYLDRQNWALDLADKPVAQATPQDVTAVGVSGGPKLPFDTVQWHSGVLSQPSESGGVWEGPSHKGWLAWYVPLLDAALPLDSAAKYYEEELAAVLQMPAAKPLRLYRATYERVAGTDENWLPQARLAQIRHGVLVPSIGLGLSDAIGLAANYGWRYLRPESVWENADVCLGRSQLVRTMLAPADLPKGGFPGWPPAASQLLVAGKTMQSRTFLQAMACAIAFCARAGEFDEDAGLFQFAEQWAKSHVLLIGAAALAGSSQGSQMVYELYTKQGLSVSDFRSGCAKAAAAWLDAHGELAFADWFSGAPSASNVEQSRLKFFGLVGAGVAVVVPDVSLAMAYAGKVLSAAESADPTRQLFPAYATRTKGDAAAGLLKSSAVAAAIDFFALKVALPLGVV